MRHATSTARTPYRFTSLPPVAAGGIEWEELPSLAEVVRERVRRGNSGSPQSASSAAAWDSTRPAELEPAPRSAPFREPLQGMGVREVLEPDVFRHFFGT